MPRTSTIFVAVAAMLLASLVAAGAAQPLDQEWRNTVRHSADGQVLLVDPTTSDVLAMTTPHYDGQIVRRLDGRSGTVQWTTEVSGAMSHLAFDRTSGRVVLAGAGTGGVRLTVLDADGAVAWNLTTAAKATVVIDLVVDAVTEKICTLGPQGRSNTAKTWVTSCWTADGTMVFSHAWSPPDGPSQPSALAIDPRSHRIYVAGTSRPYDKHPARRQDVVLLAYDPVGQLVWTTRSNGAVFPSYLDIALDPSRHRIHLLGRPGTINSPMRLFSFDAAGHKRFTTGWQDPESAYTSELAVTSSGHVLAVSAGGRSATLRSYARSGRLLRSARVRIAERDSEGGLPEVAIDPRRERAHVLNDENRPDHTARVYSFAFTGRRLSRPLVHRGKFVRSSAIVVHAASGRVVAATTLWPQGRHRITALND